MGWEAGLRERAITDPVLDLVRLVSLCDMVLVLHFLDDEKRSV